MASSAPTTPTATCATCGDSAGFAILREASDWLWHHNNNHRDPGAEIHQLPAVTFHTAALKAILTLARTGVEFTTGDCHPLVPVPPLNPSTDWPKATREAKANGWITHHSFAQSKVPTTKSSAVGVWVGTAKARTVAA